MGGGIEFEESDLCKLKTFWDTDWLYLFSIIFNLTLSGSIKSRFFLTLAIIHSQDQFLFVYT